MVEKDTPENPQEKLSMESLNQPSEDYAEEVELKESLPLSMTIQELS